MNVSEPVRFSQDDLLPEPTDQAENFIMSKPGLSGSAHAARMVRWGLVYGVASLVSTVNGAPFQEPAGQTRPNVPGAGDKEPSPRPLEPGEAESAEKPLSKSGKQKLHDTWVKRFQGAVKVLHSGKAEQVNEVETMILGEKDPHSLGPMLQVLGRETAPIRLLLDRNLAARDDELAWVALAERLLVEPEADVRRGLVRLIESKPDHPGAKRFFEHIRNALKSTNPVRSGLGALAVGDLGWKDRIPELIDRLAPVRFVRRVEWVPSAVSGGSGLAMGSVDSYVIVPVPVVGPGVVAYGQQIIPVGNGLALGGGGPSVSIQPVVRAGRMSQPNPAVRAALVALTGEDFGYDMAQWKAWFAASLRADADPPKRVPFP